MNRIISCGLILTFVYVTFASCGGASSGSVSTKYKTTITTAKDSFKVVETDIKQEKKPKIKIYSSVLRKRVKQGEDIVIDFKTNDVADSVKLFFDNRPCDVTGKDDKWIIKTDEKQRVGTINYRIVAYKYNETAFTSGNVVVEPIREPKVDRLEVVATYPHSRKAYTQGLEFYNGLLYESSGEYGKSYVRAVEVPSMKEVKKQMVDSKLFAEGITFLNNKMYMLTWQEKKCLVMNPENFKVIKEFIYNTEGWGLTTDGKRLYMSDGSHYIYIINPDTFVTEGRLEVMAGSKKIEYLNELEWINGEIWANIFTTDQIVRINPQTGVINSVIVAQDLLRKSDYKNDTDVLNGIAYNKENKKIYITGKNWPKIFEVKLKL